jgi:tRNA-intron endonuclease, archaea type
MSKNTQENNSREILVFQAHLKNKKIIINDQEAIPEFFEKSYIGSKLADSSLELDIEETLLLMERQRIKVFYGQTLIKTPKNLLIHFDTNNNQIWAKYLVYRDLRQRGYIVRQGYGTDIDFRVFSRGASRTEDVAKYFIYILNEAKPISLDKLHTITAQALKSRKILVLAVVDRLGEPTYYTLDEFHLIENKQKKKVW